MILFTALLTLSLLSTRCKSAMTSGSGVAADAGGLVYTGSAGFNGQAGGMDVNMGGGLVGVMGEAAGGTGVGGPNGGGSASAASVEGGLAVGGGMGGGYTNKGKTFGAGGGGGGGVGSASGGGMGGTDASETTSIAADEENVSLGAGTSSGQASTGLGLHGNFAETQPQLSPGFAGGTANQQGAGGGGVGAGGGTSGAGLGVGQGQGDNSLAGDGSSATGLAAGEGAGAGGGGTGSDVGHSTSHADGTFNMPGFGVGFGKSGPNGVGTSTGVTGEASANSGGTNVALRSITGAEQHRDLNTHHKRRYHPRFRYRLMRAV